MKIVHVLFSMKVGGIPALITDIANEQVKTNDVTFVVVNDLCVQSMIDGVDKRIKILRVNRKVGSWNPYYLLKLNWYVWNEHPNIVHCHAINLGSWIRLTHGAPKVLTVHNSRPKKSYEGFKQIYGISNDVCSVVKKCSGLECICVYNAIKLDRFVPTTTRYHVGDELRIVCVGRVFDYKGQYLLVEAAKILKDRGIDKFHISIIGDGDDLSHIRQMADDYHLNDVVEFLGQRSREYVYEHLRDYNFYIQPSITEGFGLTLAEAIAVGLPVLTSDLDGPLEVVAQGRYGLSFKSGNVNDLVDKIIDFKNGKISVDIDGATAFVRQEFDIEQSAKKYVVEYQKVIERK